MADGDADWENEDFDTTIKKPILHTDRWEGEDEDDDVKDNWDDEDEDKEEKSEQNIVAMQPKKKKNLAQIIAEKEEKRRKEVEEKMKMLEAEKKDLTPQEKLAYKLKQQKLQEEADLQLAKETFGVIDPVNSIDHMQPTSKEDFESFRKLLVEKITKSESSPHFIIFLEDLCRDLCLNVAAEDIKKITSSLNALANEKIKAQKAKTGKKKSKKASLNIGRGEDYAIMDYADDFDDCI
ncbi:eukaryotic translation initiation factor 3 subunit J-A [Trichonephila inaurata madagascariensis]|uniref:Eukaryotic translation initiation factor 3 subunit J n=1 Tax=Trichonephila inaurata madagascariensis TaxID=2747483 RepID=A0A8X7C8Q1_9ARAC|nr:eukaryotic translation initiation factor 3 subunit J-A [Trichonephila inaurata madagascariensis]